MTGENGLAAPASGVEERIEDVATESVEANEGVDDPAAETRSDGETDAQGDVLADDLATSLTAPHLAGLQLTKLTLIGFKSFADKTDFTFEHDVTGVVGPNGCGKSNLVDAIKWVLGERSSKSLRGKEMIDVIFAGSAGRKPSGFASVTLTFDNPVSGSDEATELDSSDEATERRSDEGGETLVDDEISEVELVDRSRVRRPLPFDADEVAVERQLYRDGTSRYLINGRRARLKDIRDLFLDTGIGADAYSIIEQGKVDAMLLASPQERRTIFEEAAGVAKYKQRRIEAQRRLARAETNLVRTREQLESTERRLRIVRGQAAKAQRFQELDGELSAWRLALAFHEYHETRERLDALTSQLQSLSRERDESAADLERLEEAQREADVARHEMAEGLSRERSALSKAQSDRASAAQRAEHAKRSAEDAAQQATIEHDRATQAKTALEAASSDLEDQRSTVAARGEELAEAERAVDELNTKRAGALEKIAERRRVVDETRRDVSRVERERSDLVSRLAAGEKQAEGVGERLERIEARSGELGERESTLREGIAATETERDRHGAEATEAGSAIEARDRSIAELSQTQRDAAEKLAQDEQELARLDSRRSTLEEMARQRVGLGEAARAVMERRESGEEAFAGILAPVAELIETDAGHARAVEAALGADLRAIVTGSLAETPSLEALAEVPGRVTFVPLRGIASDRLAVDLSAAGPLGEHALPLRSVVRGQGAEIDALLDRVLGDCVLVSSLDAAMMLAAGPMRGARFVTRDGVTLDSAGRVTAGSTEEADASGESASGLIERAAELADLIERVAKIADVVEKRRADLRATDAELSRVSEERSALATRRAEADRAHALATAKIERDTTEADRVAKELAGAGREMDELRERAAKLAAERETLSAKTESLERLATELGEKLMGAERELSETETQAQAMADQLSAARSAAARTGEQLESGRRELRRLEAEIAEAQRRVDEHTKHAAAAERRKGEHVAASEEASGRIAGLEAEVERLTAEVERRRAELDEAQKADEAQRGELGKARERAKLVERDWNGVELSRREAEFRREAIEEKALEECSVHVDAEYVEYRVIAGSGDLAPIDVDEAKTTVNELSQAIKSLGNVNLDSIGEAENLEERNEELIAQVRDIDEATKQLTALIERLNLASRERFSEAFDAIRANFGGQDGMFRRLFGGGRAEVRLMPLIKEVEAEDGSLKKVQTDEIDVLESGVEVIAKPPGKEPRSISQLSGGEKTLTAVALLMSIFRSKPSCFCILDEVDAALDEANVGRYCNAVRSFTDQSRFIIITHNKRTMQTADHLYGITQRERGVSSRVSVKFEQVGEDGEIRDRQMADGQRARVEPSGDEPSGGRSEKPSGVLRRALAGMRDGESVEVEAGS